MTNYEKMYTELFEQYLDLKETESKYKFMVGFAESMYKSGMEGYVKAIKAGNETREHYNYNQLMTCGILLGKDILHIDSELKRIKEESQIKRAAN